MLRGVLDDIQSNRREHGELPIVSMTRCGQLSQLVGSAPRTFDQDYWREMAWMYRMGLEHFHVDD